MAKNILVGQYLTDKMIEAGEQLLTFARKSSLQVVAAFWLYFEEAEEWRLALASMRLRKEGPLILYKELNDLIYDQNEYEKFGISLANTTFLDAGDDTVRALASINQTLELNSKRLSDVTFLGVHIPDVYVYFIDTEVKPL